ncbi:DUF6338 family protein [Longimicrobium sp.]|uniref:DUF6338 family protein n=1 Tax=Longimicrobium sp. TaxID=2029185 RepID=UPI002E2ECA35|nr:DUF6338 family protein [Longimicrobium sp.]HEX6040467.1 DUF6338 family protein [Longimicrobium sp.]
MELSALTLRVVLLFFPGVVCALIVRALTNRRERTLSEFLIDSFVLGLGTYLSLAAFRAGYAGVAHLVRWASPPSITFFDVLTDEHSRISWGEIALSAVVAFLLGAVVSAVVNHHLLFRVAGSLRISRKFGDPDVWSYFLNSPDIRWVSVRDVANDTVYEGAVEAFSDTGSAPELLLRNVTVSRNSTDTKLYECDRVYLARDRSTLIVEQI